jgi:hypothetical protein
VYRATEIESAFDDESIYYPPGDATTIAAPGRIPPPGFRCPSSRATVADKVGDGENFAGLHPLWVHAPWLDVRRLSVSRIDRRMLCCTLTLGAPPRADSTYGFDLTHELGGGVEEGTNVGLIIDGVGVLRPQLGDQGTLTTPPIAPSLLRIGLVGNRLELAASQPRHFTSRIHLSVQAGASSLRPNEPLLTHPLDAGDLIAPDRGCLKFPTGGITLAGICANEPGP